MLEDLKNKKILILMATYNGEKYIKDQIESLLKQSYKNWNLIISDDESKDDTYRIIMEYNNGHKNVDCIRHTPKDGALGNFNFLIKVAREKMNEYDYFMFCDQDDVWLENKIKETLKFMESKEKNEAILIYTDKQFVDKKLNYLNENSKKMSQIEFENIIHQNPAYGCTMMFNKKLLENLEEIPKEFINHDHYVLIVAFLIGKIYYLNQKLILYRQHGNNVSGNLNKTLIQKILDLNIYKKNIELMFFISEYLKQNYLEILTKEQVTILNIILNKIKKGGVEAIYYFLKLKLKKTSLKGTLRMAYEVFKCKKVEK